MKKISVSIGIPVYNEENNILHLINALLKQREIGYILKEIIVITDGSTDSTNSLVNSIKNPKIRLIKGIKRIGQQLRQNEIVNNYKGDILVIAEGDILPYNNFTLYRLIEPFLKNKNNNLGMVIGVPYPVKPNTFLENILFHSSILKSKIFSEWKKGKNVYTCGGHSMKALSRDFTNRLIWPKDVPEDAYTYLTLKKSGFVMKRSKKAKIYMKNVTNISDRIKQVTKFNRGKIILHKYFPDNIIKEEYSIPCNLIIKHILLEYLHNPLWVSLYIIELIINRLLTFKKSSYTYLNCTYNSSKKLIASPFSN